MDRRFLWGVAGLLSYIGAALVLALAVAPMFDTGGIPDIAPTDETVGLLIMSALLFGVGGLCLRRAASQLSPTSTAAVASPASGGTQSTGGDGDIVLECGNCGTQNEAFYRFCESCAERL